MDIMPLIALGILILIFGIFTKGKGMPGFLKGMGSAENNELFDEPDFNRQFLDKAAEGRSRVDLVEVFSPVDQMVIRTLLHSEGIETYIDFSSMDTILPGVRAPGQSNNIISVYNDKIDAASEIVSDYILDLKQNNAKRINEKVKNLGKYSIIGFTIPSNQYRMMPKLL